ncbi:citrate lyase beta subunit [Legionella steigerwaltii]|uniref:Citrate lyase beta subunit n=1 Tax=Legionella steigerwaltii TaxID=460 RepID=A0A378L5E8_9GAMM|nr:aldolase/citrate lyase family protein [Legionella steigerwaltii]KTD76210.1 citrate lyase beta subunit [Legionella steigerwaltii]STY22295.1 citrate lyase beta subunit [Legionella steigerwaltii]
MDLSLAPALLFTPGNKPALFEKAQASGANGLILELEDAISPAEKDRARDNVIQFLKKKHPELLTIVRINHITTYAGLPDLLAFREEDIYCDAVIYPKTESAEELNIIYKALHLEARNIKLLALIETAKGLMNLKSIVTHSPVAGLVFGAADFAVDLGCQMNWDVLLNARQQIIQAAALTHIPAIDSPFFDFTNEEQLISEVIRVKELGFKGKLAIHPRQVTPIKQNFAPSKAEVERAKEIVVLFEQSGGKACQYQGQMIDVPIYKHAQEVLKLSKHLKR